MMALKQAEKALGMCSPNPAVGAVIVKDGVVVGRGYTRPAGFDHAEVVALNEAGEKARGAVLYVTLEPCCHHGRTGPCSEAVIKAGIKEIHIALPDPNPLVCGGGVNALQEAGIIVELGEHAEEARKLNEGFLKYIATGMPFVIAKYAMSLDGKIAARTGDARWISNADSRRYVHHQRRIADAVIVGINTVLTDDPKLTARDSAMSIAKQPVRVILDSRCRIPPDARVFSQPGKTIIAVAESLSKEKTGHLPKDNVEILRVPEENGMISLRALLAELGRKQMTTVLVEGGSTVLGSLADQRLIDKVMVFIAPVIIGGAGAKTAVSGLGAETVASAMRLTDVTIDKFGDDVLVTGYLSARS